MNAAAFDAVAGHTATALRRRAVLAALAGAIGATSGASIQCGTWTSSGVASDPLPVEVVASAATPSRTGAKTGHLEANERDLAPAAPHDLQ
jgi:hypothetical protein